MFFQLRFQVFEIITALSPTDDFPITFRRQQVRAQTHFGAFRVGRHVERFHLGWIFIDKDGTIKLLADQRFIGRAKIVAPLEIRIPFGLNQLDRVIVRNAREGRHNAFQRREVAFKHLHLRRAFFQNCLHHVRHHLFRNLHVIVERPERPFRFDHPELGKMPPRFRFFRAEGWTKTIHFAECHRVRFVIKLSALREIRRIAVKVSFEKRRRAFDRCRCENRRIHQQETLLIQPIANRLDDRRAHAQDGMLPRRTQPQMAICHQEFDAVFFGRDGKFTARPLHHLKICHR